MSASASLAMAVARDEEGGEGKEGGAGDDKAPMAADKRWDSGEGKMDSGIKLTCVYLLGVGKDGGDGGSWNKSCGGATRCVLVSTCVSVYVGLCGWVGVQPYWLDVLLIWVANVDPPRFPHEHAYSLF
jgi:hypothetical protein